MSGLCFISKLVERVVASQLNDYVYSNGLENVKQSAYKLGHSTETALLSIKNDVHLALARGEATAVVLLDQSAAFDTIDHGTLLGCLSSWFGVGGVVLEWFKSYLSDVCNVLTWLYFVWCKEAPVWSTAGLCPRSYTLFLVYYSPQQSHSKSSRHRFSLLCR